MPARYRTFYRGILRKLGAAPADADADVLEGSIGLRRDGVEFPIELSFSSWRSDNRLYYGAIIRDISDRMRTERQLQVLADYDPLTNLFNRRRFQAEVDRELAVAERHSLGGALLLLDLDEFKEIRNSLGHDVGDALIRGLADRLRERVRRGDILARLGGDEFALYLPRADADRAGVLAEDLLDQVRHYTLEVEAGNLVACSVSIGVALINQHGTTVEQLLSNADTAMYRAKQNGRNSYAVYSPDFDRVDSVALRWNWEERIRRALDTDGFVLHFQPIVRLSDGHVGSYEALIRMVEDDQRLILPDQFLDVAERYGLIRDIDRWVARRAMRVLGAWRTTGSAPLFRSTCRPRRSPIRSCRGSSRPTCASIGSIRASWCSRSRSRQRSRDPSPCARLRPASAPLRLRLRARRLRHRLLVVQQPEVPAGRLPQDRRQLHSGSSAQRRRPEPGAGDGAGRARLGQHTIAEFVGDQATKGMLLDYGVDFAQGFQMGRRRRSCRARASPTFSPRSYRKAVCH